MKSTKDLEYRKVLEMARGLSFGVCLPKQYMTSLSIGKGDFVKIHREQTKIVIEKA